MALFEKHEIWRRDETDILIHIVFRDLDTGLYHCQQANHLHPGSPLSIQEQLRQHEVYVADLFFDDLPSKRGPGFATIAEAIQGFERDFG